MDEAFGSGIRSAFADHEDDFNTIEAESAKWEARFRVAERLIAEAFQRAESKRRNNAALLMGLPLAGIAARTIQQARCLALLTNRDAPHGVAPLARSLFETCCVPIYLRRELVPRLRKGRTEAVQKLAFRVGLGETGSFGGYIKPIAVDSLVGAARGELEELEAKLPKDKRQGVAQLIDIYYGPLTDLTHPNWAGLTLGMQVRPGEEPTPSLSPRFDAEVLHAVISSSAYILERGGLAFDGVISELKNTPMDLPLGEPTWNSGESRTP